MNVGILFECYEIGRQIAAFDTMFELFFYSILSYIIDKLPPINKTKLPHGNGGVYLLTHPVRNLKNLTDENFNIFITNSL